MVVNRNRDSRSGKTGRRRGATPRDPDQTRAALVNSAVTLFGQQGFHATSVQQIVDDAGRTKGAFYHFFKSKDDVLRDVHDTFIALHNERLHAVLERDIPIDQQLSQIITEVLMEPLELYKSEIAIYHRERRFLSEEANVEIRAQRDEFEDCLVDLIQRGMDTGVFRKVGPARLVAFGIIGMCAWSDNWLDLNGAMSPGQIGDMFGNMLVHGLRT